MDGNSTKDETDATTSGFILATAFDHCIMTERAALVRPALRGPVPAMLLQFRQQGFIERPGVAGATFCRTCSAFRMPAIVVLTAGWDRMNRSAISGRVIPAGTIFFSLSTRLIVCGQIFRTEISGAPVVFRKSRFERHLAAQAAFIQRDPRDHADIQFLAYREEFVFRRLVENVVDHLHHVDQPRAQRLDAVLRLPAVEAQAEKANPAYRASAFPRSNEIRARSSNCRPRHETAAGRSYPRAVVCG